MADDDQAFTRLHDGLTYKIYRASDDILFRYTVARPGGRVLTCTMTLWGARRAVRRALRKPRPGPWWTNLVEQIDPKAEANRG